MPTYNPTANTGIDYEPVTQIRCQDCGRVHTDERFRTCRECKALL